MIREWAVKQRHREGRWWLCLRCIITGEWRELYRTTTEQPDDTHDGGTADA